MNAISVHSSVAREAVQQGPSPVDVSPVAWVPKLSLPLAEWIRYGTRFGLLGRACGWWIGDWINYGNAVYGEKYSRAARITKHDVQTLMNMAYVAARFEISRRRENVSWSHHAELAALSPETQDRWLDRIGRDALTVRDLRLELRRDRAAQQRDGLEGAAGTQPRLALGDAEGHDDDQLACPRCGYVYRVMQDA